MPDTPGTSETLSDQQRALMDAANAEPTIATVMEALERLQEHLPPAVAFPAYKTSYTVGSNH